MARATARSRPERGGRVFLVLAVAAAAIAAVLVFAALNSGGSDEEVKPSAGTVDVVVASGDIPAGTRLAEGNLKIAAVAPDMKLAGAYAAAAPLVDYIARYPIAAGEQITPAKIGLKEGKTNSISPIIPPDHRGMGVTVTQVSSVGGLLLPGDMVDVIGVFSDENHTAGTTSRRAVTLFQNVEVLAVEQTPEELAPKAANAEKGDEEGETASETSVTQPPEDAEPQPDATTVTLALTPQQAQLLALAQEEGKVWLTLRPFGEEGAVELSQSTLASLIGP
jgi:pilus assembly protein CpaB